MSQIREVMAAYAALTKVFNQLGFDQRDLRQSAVQKFQDLTNDERYWMQMQALFSLGTGVVSGGAGIAASFIPNTPTPGSDAASALADAASNIRSQQNALPTEAMSALSPEMIRSGLKMVSKIAPNIGEAARIFAQGPAQTAQSAKVLAERCTIPDAQQARSDLDRERQVMADAIARIQQAKSKGA